MSALERPHFWKCNDLQKCAVSSFPSYSITDRHSRWSFSSLLLRHSAGLHCSRKVPIIQMMSHMFVADELNAKQFSSHYIPQSYTTVWPWKKPESESCCIWERGASWSFGSHGVINLSQPKWAPEEKDNTKRSKRVIILKDFITRMTFCLSKWN